jgi:ATP-dependent DNA helicase PIF1
MRGLSGNEMPYKAYDSGIVEGEQREKLLANFMAPKLLVLRRRAQVMLIKNFDETLVNGSTGQILDFVDPATYGATEEDVTGKSKEQKKGSVVKSSGQLYPLVEFLTPGGGRRQMIVTPEAWKVELPNGEVQASRIQLPLILSWAMSIHKSQGQTLERVKVDLGKVFEKGLRTDTLIRLLKCLII